jgi:Coenzyme PQQ synthesis protein D (PqqD)
MVDATFSIPRTGALDAQVMTIDEKSIVVARRDLLCCDLPEGAVILDLNSGIYYGLDEIGTLVWRLIQEPKMVMYLASAVLEEYAVESDRCLDDLKTLFTEMAERNLIEVRN